MQMLLKDAQSYLQCFNAPMNNTIDAALVTQAYLTCVIGRILFWPHRLIAGTGIGLLDVDRLQGLESAIAITY